MERERETKVGLGEGGDNTPEGGSHGGRRRRFGSDRDKRALVVVYDKASGSREGVREVFKVHDMLGDGSNNDEGVIGVLKNGAW